MKDKNLIIENLIWFEFMDKAIKLISEQSDTVGVRFKAIAILNLIIIQAYGNKEKKYLSSSELSTILKVANSSMYTAIMLLERLDLISRRNEGINNRKVLIIPEIENIFSKMID